MQLYECDTLSVTERLRTRCFCCKSNATVQHNVDANEATKHSALALTSPSEVADTMVRMGGATSMNRVMNGITPAQSAAVPSGS